VPQRSPWILPGILLGIGLVALILAEAVPEWSRLSYFVPFTFLGNSLAPLPYDGAVVYLGAHHPLWVIVPIAVAATLLIEAWNMELLARMLAREGTRAFRNHRFTKTSLRWYRKAPFWSLVLTCVLPIMPHYPCGSLLCSRPTRSGSTSSRSFSAVGLATLVWCWWGRRYPYRGSGSCWRAC